MGQIEDVKRTDRPDSWTETVVRWTNEHKTSQISDFHNDRAQIMNCLSAKRKKLR